MFYCYQIPESSANFHLLFTLGTLFLGFDYFLDVFICTNNVHIIKSILSKPSILCSYSQATCNTTQPQFSSKFRIPFADFSNPFSVLFNLNHSYLVQSSYNQWFCLLKSFSQLFPLHYDAVEHALLCH